MNGGIRLLSPILTLFLVSLAIAPAHANFFENLADKFQQATATLQNGKMQGIWLGHATIPGSAPYSVFIAIQPDLQGQWAYAQAGCEGTLTPGERNGGAQKFTPEMTKGTCQLGGGIQLTPQGDDQMKWEWLDAQGNVAMSTVLLRADEDATAELRKEISAQQHATRERRGATGGREAMAREGANPEGQAFTSEPNVALHLATETHGALNQQHAMLEQRIAKQDKPNLFERLKQAGNADQSSNPSTTQVDLPKELMPIGQIQYLGKTTKRANMRAVPSTEGQVLTVVSEGSQIGVSPVSNNWHMVQAIVDGEYHVGYIYHTLVSTELTPIPQPAAGMPRAGETSVAYAGYSKSFQDIRVLITSGDLDQIEVRYAEAEAEIQENSQTRNEDKLKQRIGVLRWLERGTLALDQGLYEPALSHFTAAEELVERKESRGSLRSFVGGLGTKIAETFSGNEEMQPYRADGWEKVLMLNYKSIAFLLEGDRRAYNVTRRAIDWQNIEKKKFDQAVAEEEAKLEKESERERIKRDNKQAAREIGRPKGEAEGAQESADESSSTTESQPNKPAEEAIAEILNRMTDPMQKKANSVGSAYVNPFGFYVAGMIQEFESYDDPSLMDNARISYAKGLALNPTSKVLEEAVSDMKAINAPRDVNLVHVVVANGFVPAKKVLTYHIQTDSGRILPLKLPLYEPVETKVDRIEVHSMSGEKLATLSTVADVEALCLRQQQDMQKLQVLRAFASYLVGGYLAGTADASTGLAAEVVGAVSDTREEGSSPDTRSWMSLPATIQASRLRLPKGVDQLRLVTFDSNGRRLESKSIGINAHEHGVVYARTTDRTIYLQSSENLWMF